MVDLFEKGKKAAFARKAGISPQGAQELLAGRKGDPSFKVLIKILEAYPQISTDWVLFGKGDMLLPEAQLGHPARMAAENETVEPFLPPGYNIDKVFEEMWEERSKAEDEKREKDRLAIWGLVDYLAKNDDSGEIAKIRQLLASALAPDIDPSKVVEITDVYYRGAGFEDPIGTEEKQGRKSVKQNTKQAGQQ
ncbi:helix-turn-helix domain-containing protein [Hymenobacter lapidarius]|uniref:helix-turn-helix domain-containing protein n=1 Tax=Hymenobacter lapidarius TaxID=1908237 RepID=UPI0008A49D63|nr:helix-turn-helix transcriptional regulator [Hymenobacter lapidarius]